MADLVLETPEGVPLRFELAGAGARILAASLDALLIVLVVGGAVLAFQVAGLHFAPRLILAGVVLLLVAYAFLCPLLLDGASPGKLWTGIRVRDAQGFRAGPVQLLLRALFVPLESALVVPVPFVWVLIAATPRRQRLGDLVASTVVLRARVGRVPPEPVPGLAWSALESRAFALDPASVRGLTGRDLGFLRDLLTRADLDPHAREPLYARAAERYAERLDIPAPRDPAAARTFLRELFLCLREVRGNPELLTARPAAGGATGRGAPRASGSAPR